MGSNKMREPSLQELDFEKSDWKLLGKPIPDSQVRWGIYDMEEMVDIIAPDYTLEDYHWLRDDPMTEHYLRTLEIAGESRRNDKYGTGNNNLGRVKPKGRKSARYLHHHSRSIEEEVTGIATLVNNLNTKEANDE